MAIFLAGYLIIGLVIGLIFYYKFNIVASFISIIVWSIMALIGIIVMNATMIPKDQTLTEIPKGTDTPSHFMIDPKERVIYSEDRDGSLEFYAGDNCFTNNISFYESTRVKSPVVKLDVKRVYRMDDMFSFKITSDVEVTVDRVLIPVNYNTKSNTKVTANIEINK